MGHLRIAGRVFKGNLEIAFGVCLVVSENIFGIADDGDELGREFTGGVEGNVDQIGEVGESFFGGFGKTVDFVFGKIKPAGKTVAENVSKDKNTHEKVNGELEIEIESFAVTIFSFDKKKIGEREKGSREGKEIPKVAKINNTTG